MSLIVLMLAAALTGVGAGRRLKLDASPAALTVRMLVGVACAALVALLLGLHSLRLAQAGIYAMAVAGAVCELSRRKRPHYAEFWPCSSRPKLAPLETIALAVIVGTLALAWVRAAVPVTDWDAVVMHLAVPAAYARSGRIGPAPMPGAAMPHLAYSLYTWAFHMGGEGAASRLAWLFAVGAVAAVFSAAHELAGRRAAFIAAALLATSPMFQHFAAIPGTAIPVTAFAAGAMAAMLRWQRTGARGWMLAAGLLAGSACGAGYGGVLLACAFAIWPLAMHGRRRAAGLYAAAALLAALPWMLHAILNAASAGVSLSALLLPHSALRHVQTPARLDLPHMHGNSPADFVMHFWNLFMRPSRAGEWTFSPGALLVWVGLPAVLGGKHRAWPWAGAAVAGAAVLFFLDRRPQALFPWLAIAAAVVAAGTVALPKLRRTATVLLGCWFVYAMLFAAAATLAGFPVLAGIESADVYTHARTPAMPAYDWLGSRCGPDGVVLSLDPRVYRLPCPAFTNFHALKDLTALSPIEQHAWLIERGIAWVVLPSDFVKSQPYLRESGIADMTLDWRSDAAHFARAVVFSPREDGAPDTERLEVLRVRP